MRGTFKVFSLRVGSYPLVDKARLSMALLTPIGTRGIVRVEHSTALAHTHTNAS
jgi:hypothetical protein